MADALTELRIKNLKKLIEESYNGDYQQVASLIGRSEDTLRKYYRPSGRVELSDKVTRRIEQQLQLSPKYLDRDNDNDRNIYYVMVFVKDSETYEIIEWLYHHSPEVKDCSTVLGQFDIILKIEVPNFHYLERFFSKLKRIPNVMRTQTFASVDSLRWQREQFAYTNIEDPLIEKSFIDHYKNTRIHEFNQRIRDIENGDIVAYENAQEKISLLEMMKWARKSYISVREYREKINQADEYFEEEEKNIKKGMESKRIFTIPRIAVQDKNDINNLMKEAKKFIDMNENFNVDIRFVFENEWLSHKKPECFAIVDECFVYVRGDSGDKSRLKEKDKDVKHYQNLFEKNWSIGLTYKNFKKKYADRDFKDPNEEREYLP